jgi:hypothetical protein
MEHRQSLKGKGPGAFSDIPEGYFEQLPDTVWAAIHLGKKPEQKNRQMKILSWAAAVVLLAAIGTIWFMKPDKPEMQMALNGQISDTVKNTVGDKPQHNDVVDNGGGLMQVTNLQTNENPNFHWESDSLLLDLITYEEIMDYLIDQNEFEF